MSFVRPIQYPNDTTLRLIQSGRTVPLTVKVKVKIALNMNVNE
jgi:hypothetical protein